MVGVLVNGWLRIGGWLEMGQTMVNNGIIVHVHVCH